MNCLTMSRIERSEAKIGGQILAARHSAATIERMSALWQLPRRVVSRIKREIGWRRRASLMRKIRGVIHVGANLGQERDDYAHLNVVWIEPIPELFAQLMQNIAGYPRQAAYRALITDTNVADCVLHVASNEGGSSSVLDLAMHRDIWPDIGFVADIHMPSMTLDTFVEREAIDLSRFNLLVMDTQGSELLVLRGASKTLRAMDAVVSEVADFEAYRNCARPGQIAEFLSTHRFRELMREPTAQHPSGGFYYEIVYRRV